MSEEECPKCPPEGLPAWMGTFADLMSLLMCFFVLLLSFAEMDVLKFKQIAGSMKFAFGVQNKLEVKDIPKGTSVIAQEFRPGRPDPTPIRILQQQTMEITKQVLEFEEGE
ncbi:MAG: flagellar motor protein MotB, partial [Gammaproteobacteria bacterium]|nr:flagellar motor protein MotB [Gammaproteobacteria bacterium]